MQQISPSNQAQLQSYLNTAIEIAQQAGQVILEMRQHQSFSQDYKAGHELVTSADLKADQLIRTQLQLQFPEHGILSEESSPDCSNTQSLYQPMWIIDPIDGTVNYAHGLQQVGISIAYAEQGEVKAGVVYAPFTGECFAAISGEAATLNGDEIQISQTQELRKALVATGFPYDKSKVPALLPRLHKILTQCQDLRRGGSAAMDICYVACGRLDAYYETVSPWDFAAARLIALQAGAQAGHLDGRPKNYPAALYGEQMIVANPSLYAPLYQLLQKENEADK